MRYLVTFGTGDKEIVECNDLLEAREAVEDYGMPISKIVALNDGADEDLDDGSNPEDDVDSEFDDIDSMDEDSENPDEDENPPDDSTK